MDAEMQGHAREAIARFDRVLDEGLDVAHADIQAAVNAVASFRNRAIKKHGEGAVSDTYLERANALVSLAYGAEFPLSGLHRRRFEQTRAGMQKLLETD